MDLYYALTTYHQLECVLYKLFYRPNNKAHLYLSNSIIIEEDLQQRLLDSGLFEEVVVLDDSFAWQVGSKVKVENEEIFESVMDEIADTCFAQLLQPIETYDELYIFADHFPLGFSLAYREIPYHYFEEATGAHSRRAILLEEIKCKNHFWYLVFIKLGARGESDCIIDKFIDFDFQLQGFHDEKAVDFGVKKLLCKLSPKDKKMLCSILGEFHIETGLAGNPLALLLTQHYAAASITTYEGQCLLYALLLDYFTEGLTGVIKPHPTDRQGVYRSWFPGIHMLNREIPAELLSLLVEEKFQLIISATSSSAYNLSDIAHNVMTFESEDNRFDKLFYSMNRYFVATYIIKKYYSNCNIFTLGADTKQVENFLESMNGQKNEYPIYEKTKLKSLNTNAKNVLIIDDLSLTKEDQNNHLWEIMKTLNDDSVIIFINSSEDVAFYNPNDTEWGTHLVPLAIEKKAVRENPYMALEKEWMFLYTKNNKMKRELLNIQIDKLLNYTGIEIHVGGNVSQKEKLLEAMLYATEKKCIKMNAEIEALKLTK